MSLTIYPMPARTNVTTSIENFRKVDDTLYRGALPKPDEILGLKRQGFDTIVSLRSGFDKKGLMERGFVEKIGMEFANFPINSLEGPSEEVADAFLKYMDDAKKANKKIYMHCKHGKDRSGTMTALYELQFKVKSYKEAIKELFEMGYNNKKHPHMLEFINNFAKNLKR